LGTTSVKAVLVHKSKDITLTPICLASKAEIGDPDGVNGADLQDPKKILQAVW